MAGRPRKPKKLHLLHGTARAAIMAERIGELDLPSGPVGPPPEYIQGEALAEWERLTGDPHYSAVLSPVFRGILIEYCLLHAEMVTDASGGQPMKLESRRLLTTLRMQLGLTPASQSKVQSPKVEKPTSKWADVG